MSLDPHNFLICVHPDLVKVTRRAWLQGSLLTPPRTFQVTYGLRTVAEELKAVNSGHSTTMHSRHLAGASGYACAIDFAVIIDGILSYAPGREAEAYTPCAELFKAASAELSIPIEWGGDWKSFHDWGHVQLPWAQYP